MPIELFKTGLDTDLDPRLLPTDAFQEAVNCHIHHGKVEKREGFRKFGEMVHSDANFMISAATMDDPVVITIVSTASFTTGDRIQINYVAGMTELNGVEFTVTVLGGTTLSLQDLERVDIDGTGFTAYTSGGTVSTFPGNRIMGLFRYISSFNIKTLLSFDDRRVAIYDATNDSFEPLINSVTGAFDDIFSSSSIDYVWTENWASTGSSTDSTLFRLYFTNGLPYDVATDVDGIWYYSSVVSNSVILFRPQINSTTFINGCQLIFAIKQRLVLLNTIEGSNFYPQRARWCQVQNPDATGAWDDNVAGKGGFFDAPTGDHIISARPLQDGIIVLFTDSVWTLRPTADPALPFRWDKINDFRSCGAKMGTQQYDRYVLAFGQRGITATDGVETRRIDERIEDFVTDTIDAKNFNKTYSQRSYYHKRGWTLFSKADSTSVEADAALIYDEESASFTTYDIDLNVLGYGSKDIDYSASDFTAANDLDKSAEDFNDGETASSFSWQKESELFLGGNINGLILQLEQQGNDNDESYELILQSTAWDPFKEEGVESQLGYIDFLIDTDKETRFEVSFFKDDNETPYEDPVTGLTSQGVDCLPNLNYITDVVGVVPKSPITDGFTVSAPKHGLTTDDFIYMYGVGNVNYVNDEKYQVTVVDGDTFDVSVDISGEGATITGISQANPAVVTAANSFENGDQITIVDVVGMVEVNSGIFTVANRISTSFELEGVDSTGFTLYTSGGVAIKSITNSGFLVEKKFDKIAKTWKRVYAGGIGYQHHIKITSSGADKPITFHAFKPYFRKRGKRTI